MTIKIIDERTNEQYPVADLKPNAVFCTAEMPNIRYLLTDALKDSTRVAVNLETGSLIDLNASTKVIILDAMITIKK